MKGLNKTQCDTQGFTLIEMSLSVGIAATWILLSLGLIGLLVEQVQRNRQVPVMERANLLEVKAPIQFRMPRPEIDEASVED